MRQAIEKEMKRQKVSRYRLAKDSGVPKSSVYRFLDGKDPSDRVDLAHVDAMLKALNLTVSPAPARRPGRRR